MLLVYKLYLSLSGCLKVGKKTKDLICQISDALPSVVQHVPHTKDGAGGVVLWVVVTVLDLFSCHCSREVPSKER